MPTARSARWALLPQGLGQVGTELAGVDVQPRRDVAQPNSGFVEGGRRTKHVVNSTGRHGQIAPLHDVTSTSRTAAVERTVHELRETERLAAVPAPCRHVPCAPTLAGQ